MRYIPTRHHAVDTPRAEATVSHTAPPPSYDLPTSGDVGEGMFDLLVVALIALLCLGFWRIMQNGIHSWMDRAFRISNPDVLFHESGASGRDLDSAGGRARGCLRVTVTRDSVLIRPAPLLRIFAWMFGMDYRIPARRVISVTEGRSLFRKTVVLKYRSGLDTRKLELVVREPRNLAAAVTGIILHEPVRTSRPQFRRTVA